MKNKFYIKGDTAIIEVRCKGKTINYVIDAEDIDKVHNFSHGTWHSTCNNDGRYRYAMTSIKGKKILLHRLIMNAPNGLVVDHIDHNPLNNRKCNLRVVSHAENMRNRSKTTASKRSYIYKENRRGKMMWVIRINEGDKRRNLGRFKDYSEAEKVLDEYLESHIQPTPIVVTYNI